MNNIPQKYNIIRYVFENMDVIMPDGNNIKLNTSLIESMYIEKSYSTDIHPILRVRMPIEPLVWYNILKNKTKVKIRLRIVKYVYYEDNTFNYKTMFINKVFGVIIEEDTPFLSEKDYAKTQAIEGDTTPDDFADMKNLYLFLEEDLKATKNPFSGNFSGTMTDILTYLFSNANVNRVLMTPLDNKKHYDNVILSPTSLIGAINSLDEMYGFYNNGKLLFFDFNYTYLLDKSSKCTAWCRNEYTTTVITVYDNDSTNNMKQGIAFDQPKKTYYINASPSSIAISNKTMGNEHIDSNNIISVNNKDGNIKKIDTDVIQRGTGNYAFVENKYNNNFALSEQKLMIEENSIIINFSTEDIDIDALTPNKEIRVIFNDIQKNKKYGGSYRITKLYSMFQKQGDDFAPTVSIEIKRHNELTDLDYKNNLERQKKYNTSTSVITNSFPTISKTNTDKSNIEVRKFFDGTMLWENDVPDIDKSKLEPVYCQYSCFYKINIMNSSYERKRIAMIVDYNMNVMYTEDNSQFLFITKDGNVVALEGDNKTLKAIDTNGKSIWTFDLDKPEPSNKTIGHEGIIYDGNKYIYVYPKHGEIYRLNAQTGTFVMTDISEGYVSNIHGNYSQSQLYIDGVHYTYQWCGEGRLVFQNSVGDTSEVIQSKLSENVARIDMMVFNNRVYGLIYDRQEYINPSVVVMSLDMKVKFRLYPGGYTSPFMINANFITFMGNNKILVYNSNGEHIKDIDISNIPLWKYDKPAYKFVCSNSVNKAVCIAREDGDAKYPESLNTFKYVAIII